MFIRSCQPVFLRNLPRLGEHQRRNDNYAHSQYQILDLSTKSNRRVLGHMEQCKTFPIVV